MSCLCLLTVGDLMRLAISGEKLLEMGTRREARTRGAWPFSLAPSSESCYALPFGKRVAARDFQQDCVVGSKLSWTLEISEIWNTFLSWPSSEPPFPHVGGYVSCVKGGFCWMPASEVDCQVKFWWTPFLQKVHNYKTQSGFVRKQERQRAKEHSEFEKPCWLFFQHHLQSLAFCNVSNMISKNWNLCNEFNLWNQSISVFEISQSIWLLDL